MLFFPAKSVVVRAIATNQPLSVQVCLSGSAAWVGEWVSLLKNGIMKQVHSEKHYYALSLLLWKQGRWNSDKIVFYRMQYAVFHTYRGTAESVLMLIKLFDQ